MSEESIHINSTADLVAALRDADPDRRLAVCEAIAAAPDAVAAFPPEDGRDVLDELLDSLPGHRPGSSEWIARFNAVAAFDDPRSREAALAVLQAGESPAAVLLAEERIGRESPRWRRAALREALFSGNALVARAAARQHDAEAAEAEDDAVRVRLGLLTATREPAPCAGAALDGYITELAGPFAVDAQAALMLLGTPAAEALLAAWPRLDPDSRAWLLPWAARVAPGAATPYIADALGGDARLLGAALTAAGALADPAPLATSLRPLLDHDEPTVRAAAVRLLAEAEDWAGRLAAEPAPEVRAALVSRLTRPDCIGRHLGDPSWQVRAAAVSALVAQGDAGRALARSLATEAEGDTKAAAVTALAELGDDAWLLEHLLS